MEFSFVKIVDDNHILVNDHKSKKQLTMSVARFNNIVASGKFFTYRLVGSTKQGREIVEYKCVCADGSKASFDKNNFVLIQGKGLVTNTYIQNYKDPKTGNVRHILRVKQENNIDVMRTHSKNTVNYTCIGMKRDKNNIIQVLRLKDANGNIRDVSKKAVKEAIKAGRVNIDNLYITEDNKLRTRKPEEAAETSSPKSDNNTESNVNKLSKIVDSLKLESIVPYISDTCNLKGLTELKGMSNDTESSIDRRYDVTGGNIIVRNGYEFSKALLAITYYSDTKKLYIGFDLPDSNTIILDMSAQVESYKDVKTLTEAFAIAAKNIAHVHVSGNTK